MVLVYKKEDKNSSRPEDGLCHNEERLGQQPIKTFDLNNQLGCPLISQTLIGNKSGAIDLFNRIIVRYNGGAPKWELYDVLV